jgi:hypothetical protein
MQLNPAARGRICTILRQLYPNSEISDVADHFLRFDKIVGIPGESHPESRAGSDGYHFNFLMKLCWMFMYPSFSSPLKNDEAS